MDRRGAILRRLSKTERVTVDELVTLLQASPATVRRDLSFLETEGKVIRTHGGATLAPSTAGETNFLTRQRSAATEKRAMADLALKAIPSEATLFIDSGTTCFELAKRLFRSGGNYQVYTNSIPILELASKLDFPVHLSGGKLRPMSKALVGPHAERWLEPLWFDMAIVGASALHESRGLFTTDAEEAALKRKACQVSHRTLLLADGSKLDSQAQVNFAAWSQIDRWITSRSAAAPALQSIRDAHEIQIDVADA